MRYLRDEGPYPDVFRQLPDPPRVVTTTGPLDARGRRIIAIVGSRHPTDDARTFARDLARELAVRGVIVASGGALGVDGEAHRGALDARGATWAVLPTPPPSAFPEEHLRLFQAIAMTPGGRLVWPVMEGWGLKYRNGVVCALADAVVVVQAHYKSGSLNASRWATQLGRPLWMVPSTPWDGRYSGALPLLASGAARPMWSMEGFLDAFDRAEHPDATAEVRERFWGPSPPQALPWPKARVVPKAPRNRRRPSTPQLPGLRSDAEKTILSALSVSPTHVNDLVRRTGLATSAAVTALLTLALEDVVVEGPDGFFRLQNAD